MNSKKLAMALLKRAKPEDVDVSAEAMPPLDEVMTEFIDAVKSGDAKAAAKAFRAASACAEDHAEDEDDQESQD